MSTLRHHSSDLAVIGGSGLYTLDFAERTDDRLVSTPYAIKPVVVQQYLYAGHCILFLPRHASDHSIPPHRVNYKANLHALQLCGIKKVLSMNAVGGISAEQAPGAFCVPDQIIDYTWGREHTFNDELSSYAGHIDFTYPYSSGLRRTLCDAAQDLGVLLVESGVYGCTQGPRLETAAEISRMAQDGCDVVGQTGMPEAALARELEMEYASLCLVVNKAAGLEDRPLSLDDIRGYLASGTAAASKILAAAVTAIHKADQNSASASD